MCCALIFAVDSTTESRPGSSAETEGFIPLGPSGYWASPDLLRIEAEFYRAVDFFQNEFSPLKLDAEKLAAGKTSFIAASKSRIDKAELDEQLCAVFGTFERGARLSVITGPPGAAKSTIAGLWMQFVLMQHPAMPVILIAQEKTALDRLYDKIAFDGACAWTVETAVQRDWPRNASIIIDEAGILGTETMAALLQKAAKSDSVKTILIGDDKQLVPHAPGQPFRWLCSQPKIDKILLSQSFRQKTTALRQAVKALYNEDVPDALRNLSFQILPPETILNRVRELTANTTPEKTLIVVHGPKEIGEQLKILCPDFRVLCLAASQGLAVDRVIFVLCEAINRAELLVGCSRQRYGLEVLIDASVYSDEQDFIGGIAPYPTGLMALDIIDSAELLKLAAI
jgi:hypothetical protein